VSDLIDSRAQLNEGPYPQARLTCLRALTAAERLADPILMEAAHRPLTMLELAIDGPGQARRRALHALRLVHATGVPTLEPPPRFLLVFIDFLGGDWERAQRGAIELLALGHRVGNIRATVGGLAGRALVLTSEATSPKRPPA
jgi:hypothetical protein